MIERLGERVTLGDLVRDGDTEGLREMVGEVDCVRDMVGLAELVEDTEGERDPVPVLHREWEMEGLRDREEDTLVVTQRVKVVDWE